MASADRLIEIFNAAKARTAGAERERFLQGACLDERELTEQVRSLLQAHEGAGDFLKHTLLATRIEATEMPGAKIGRYRLLEKVGEGGCGVVYVAEQTEPVRRRVALKVIKLGMDTQQVVARFGAERQALAMMDHPNIAKVLDAGATEQGRPYFVMELVRGIRITDYCHQAKLTTHERLALFIKVCHAIQHAHQKGIIHRDIKPSNILVTLHDGVPVPKVIDFGIAKATEGRLTDATVYTQLHQFIGTPAYMSPEQAEMSGLDIDTRSDIYSLGVLLYELLTGSTPFDAKELMNSGIDAMRKTIREQEPVRPSTRLTRELTLGYPSASGGTSGRGNGRIVANAKSQEGGMPSSGQRSLPAIKELINLLRGDLDWIIMRCLEKDRARRYDTANGLAADLHRHLNHEPVMARPPSAAYKFQKAWQRNKLAFSATGAVGLALLVGISLTTWQASVASSAQKTAEAEKTRAEHQLYVANMFSAGQAWEENNLAMVRQLLADTRDSSHRGFEWYYWQRQTHLNLMTLYGHLDKVKSIAFFPDSQRIVTGSEDKSARVWDLATGEERLQPLAHTTAVNSVAVSRDGKQIATASRDQTVILWDANSGRELLRLKGQWGPVTALAFSPDGKSIVTGGTDGSGRIWDLATQRVIVTLEGHSHRINSVAFSPDGEKVATASHDYTARIWRSADGAKLSSLTGHTREIMAVVFSPDGKTILTGSLDQFARFWDAETGAPLSLQIMVDDPIDALAFFPDGRRMVTGSRSSAAKVWNATDGRRDLHIRGHVRGLNAVAVSPDGTRVVTGGFDRNVKVWDTDGGREQLQVEGNPTNAVLAVAISPDGERVATGRGTFKNDGSASGSGDQALQVWDLNTKKMLLSISGHGSGISAVAFSPNGTRILSGSGDHTAKLWDAARGGLVTTFKAHAAPVTSVAFFPNEERIVTGSQDQTARVWNLATGREILILSGHTNTISSVAISPDGQRIATGGFDETVRVWEAATGRLMRTIEVPNSRVYSVAFSPDNRRLAISGWEPPTVWDLEDSNRKPITLQGHNGPASSVVFSRDGLRLVTGCLNGRAKVWEAATGRELLTLRGRTQHVYSIAISADGRRILAGSADRTVGIWEAATPNQVALWEAEEQAAAALGAGR